jgi:hypothetical protein
MRSGGVGGVGVGRRKEDLSGLKPDEIKIVEEAEDRVRRRNVRVLKWTLAIALMAFIGATLGRAWGYEQQTRVLVVVDGVQLNCLRVVRSGHVFLEDCERMQP